MSSDYVPFLQRKTKIVSNKQAGQTCLIFHYKLVGTVHFKINKNISKYLIRSSLILFSLFRTTTQNPFQINLLKPFKINNLLPQSIPSQTVGPLDARPLA